MSFELKTAQNDLLKIEALGAKIEVSLGGVLVLGSFQRGDAKTGITHPCTPVFGPDRKNLYGLQQHGNMRNENCEVQQKEDRFIVSHLITDTGYPAGMQVEQMITVEDGVFAFEMKHTNTGEKETSVNAGEHCYFDAPNGYQGTTINGLDITKLIQNNYDGIAIDLGETNIIKIPGKPVMELVQEGFKKAVVWVGKNPETKAIDTTYVCIEPVEDDPFGDFFGSHESIIPPGENRVVHFTLRFI